MAGTLTLDEENRDGPWDELIGRSVGSYRIARLLGKGGMGAVYLARHPAIGSQVAVKFLHPRFSGDRNHVERFFNEARAVNLIGHENIVKTLDFSVTPDGRHYFVMEYLSGRALSSFKGPMPLEVAGPILLQTCRALQAAHERNIVHRDLKPDNVFLISQMGKKNFVKLVDFGIAKLVDPKAGAGLTEAGALIGTPEYMSPEQAAGRTAEVGRRSDVYSLGVLMYQLATGRVPFSAASTAETLVAHLQQKPVAPREIEPSIPAAYEAVILKALEKKKEDRWQSMAELHQAISSCMKDLGLSAELPAADPEPVSAPAPLAPTPQPEERVPITSTWAGDRAPLHARVERFADWALAPSRRVRSLGAALGAIGVIVWAAWPPAKSVEKKNPPPMVTAAPPANTVAKSAPPPNPLVKPPPQPAKPVEPPREVKPPPARKIAKRPPAPKQPAPAVAPPPAAPPGPMTAADAAHAVSEHTAALRAAAEMNEAAASAARADAAAAKPPPGVRLFVVSDPLGASVTAAWSGKSASGLTPMVFRVRRGAAVTLSFSKPGWSPEVRQLTAAEAQAVRVELREQR